MRNWFNGAGYAALWALTGGGALLLGQSTPPQAPDFVQELYPVFEAAGCRGCHSDDGVASTTRLRFPPGSAATEEVAAFGLRLSALIDRERIETSLLLQKPTNRIPHTGGERIVPGSEQEAALRRWVEHLAAIAPEELIVAGKPQRVRPSAAPQPLRRLTHSQYDRTVRDLLGALTQPARRFPPEDYVNGFKNQTAAQTISPSLTEAYGAAAERLADTAFRYGDTAGLIPCSSSGPLDRACAGRFVREFGLRAFRRPLSEGEAEQFEKLLLAEAGRCGDFLQGARIVVEAMLLSPAFLFHVEAQPDGRWRQYAVANRLSYFLWDTMPDDELFGMAERGELGDEAGVERAARRMLDDPRAREAAQEFFAQWLELDRLPTMVKDRRRFRQFSPELAAAMAEETRRFLDDLVWNDRNFMEFLTAEHSFVNADLADLYGLPAPAEEFGRIELPEDSRRAGVLGQASILAATSQPGESSPTIRGLFVRERLLCQKVPPPPPGVNTDLPPLTGANLRGTRQRLQAHVSDPSCASCHKLIDGIGFGFEHFDAIGRWRDKQYVLYYPTGRDADQGENEVETYLDIDPQAEVVGIRGSEFSSPRELSRILAGNNECRKCVVRQLFRYAFGRLETPTDGPVIDRALERFEASGFRFRELLLALAVSPEFREGR